MARLAVYARKGALRMNTVVKFSKWHKADEMTPELTSSYYEKSLQESDPVLVVAECPDGRKEYGIGAYVFDHFDKIGDWVGCIGYYELDEATVLYWTELPDPPEGVKVG